MRGVRGAGSSSRAKARRHERRKRDREAAAAGAEHACIDDDDSGDERDREAAAVTGSSHEHVGVDDLLADNSGELDVAATEKRYRVVAALDGRGREAAAHAHAARPDDAALAAQFRESSRLCYLCETRFLTDFRGRHPLCTPCRAIARAESGASTRSAAA